jgi:bifunctional non-homologous end joining protein LigD
MVLDLDPAPELPWDRVVEGAHLTRALLQSMGLESFAKTTGGKGLHLIVPLARRHTWEEVQRFARGVGEHLAAVLPSQFTMSANTGERTGRIFLDPRCNMRVATVFTAYAPRARPGAPVSMPLSWEELAANVGPEQYSVRTLPGLLSTREDPWSDYWSLHHSLTPEMSARLGAKQ